MVLPYPAPEKSSRGGSSKLPREAGGKEPITERLQGATSQSPAGSYKKELPDRTDQLWLEPGLCSWLGAGVAVPGQSSGWLKLEK